MLAARDQENLVHAHQQTAAGKPLNQGVRQLQPKTPGNRAPKTPFKIPLNDENASFAFPGQKTALKNIGRGNENIQTSKKDGKVDKNAFVTPLGPKTRAPLGMKTTNAKARAFQTPGLGEGKPLQTIKRPSTVGTKKKSKIVVAQPEPAQADILTRDEDDDIPDIEYMPPKPVELADPPEDITYDQTFPQFQGRNMFRGWAQLYGPPVGKDGLTDTDRIMEERYAKIGEEVHRKLDEDVNRDISIDPEVEADVEVQRILQSHFEGKRKEVGTVVARGAAAALNAPSKDISRLAKPTLASQRKSKVPSKLLPTSKKPTPPATNPSPMRHTALAAASRSTVGYSKGRNVSSKLSDIANPSARAKSSVPEEPTKYDMSPKQFKNLFGEPPEGSDMWYRLHAHDNIFGIGSNDVDEVEDDIDALKVVDILPEEEDEDDVFQL